MTATKKILVVDDDPELRSGVSALLERRGFSTLQADDGHEARQMIDQERPDLVILDMMMPRWGGFAVLEHFQGRTDAPAFIMITATEGTKHRAYAQQIGVADYIQKPFTFDRLLQGVTKTLELDTEEKANAVREVLSAFRSKCFACGARIKTPRAMLNHTRPCPGCKKTVRLVPMPPDDEGPVLAPFEVSRN